MDLGLEIEVRRNGRQPVEVAFSVERELAVEDVAAMAEERGTKAPLLKRLSDRHHTLARLVASGMKLDTAATTVGYNGARVSILKSDPMFIQLVNFYRSQEAKVIRDLGEKLSGLASDAIDALSDRLEDEDERKKIPTGHLLEMAKVGADRSGFGPQSTTTQVNIHANLADRMQAARQRAAESAGLKTIEGTISGEPE